MDNSSSNNNTINRIIKYFIIVLGILIIGVGVAIVTAVVHIKNKTKLQNSATASKDIIMNLGFDSKCKPLAIETKDYQINIFSKSCSVLKIIDLKNNKIYSVNLLKK